MTRTMRTSLTMIGLWSLFWLGSCQTKGSEPPVASAQDEVSRLNEQVGMPLANAPLVAIEDLQKDPAAFEGKTIRVSGRVVDMCFHKRTWFGMTSASGDKVVRVITGRNNFLVPEKAVGADAIAEGVVEVITLDPAEMAHYKDTHKFVSDEEIARGGPVRQPVVYASGAQFVR